MKDISPDIEAVARSYQYQKPPDILVSMQDLVAKFLRLISDWLSAFHITLPGLADSRAVSNVMQLILMAAGIAGACVLLLLVWSRLRHFKREGNLARKGAVQVTRILDATGWKDEAERLAGQGDFRGASRAVYLSLLQLLHERGIAEFAPTKTNYEYWWALAKCPAVQRRFRDIVNPVESVWFGNKTAEGADYQKCLHGLRELELEVARLCESPETRGEGAGHA